MKLEEVLKHLQNITKYLGAHIATEIRNVTCNPIDADHARLTFASAHGLVTSKGAQGIYIMFPDTDAFSGFYPIVVEDAYNITFTKKHEEADFGDIGTAVIVYKDIHVYGSLGLDEVDKDKTILNNKYEITLLPLPSTATSYSRSGNDDGIADYTRNSGQIINILDGFNVCLTIPGRDNNNEIVNSWFAEIDFARNEFLIALLASVGGITFTTADNRTSWGSIYTGMEVEYTSDTFLRCVYNFQVREQINSNSLAQAASFALKRVIGKNDNFTGIDINFN